MLPLTREEHIIITAPEKQQSTKAQGAAKPSDEAKLKKVTTKIEPTRTPPQETLADQTEIRTLKTKRWKRTPKLSRPTETSRRIRLLWTPSLPRLSVVESRQLHRLTLSSEEREGIVLWLRKLEILELEVAAKKHQLANLKTRLHLSLKSKARNPALSHQHH